MTPEVTVTEDALQLFKRDGMYYLRANLGAFEEPLEIALHGILSDKEALAAAAALSPYCNMRQAEEITSAE